MGQSLNLKQKKIILGENICTSWNLNYGNTKCNEDKALVSLKGTLYNIRKLLNYVCAVKQLCDFEQIYFERKLYCV